MSQQYYWNGDQQVVKKPSFYEKTWVIILSCLFLPPLGIAFVWMSKRPKNKVLRILLTIFLVIYSLSWIGGFTTSQDSSTKSESKNVSEEQNSFSGNDEETSEAENTEEKIAPEEYKNECEELNYKDVMRNPDDYVGRKFKVTAEIFSDSNSYGTKYYKVYDDDGSGNYFNNMMYMIDMRSEDDEGYVKLLKGDVVTFYGEFTGLSGSKNSITGEKSEEMSLDVYYAELISE